MKELSVRKTLSAAALAALASMAASPGAFAMQRCLAMTAQDWRDYIASQASAYPDIDYNSVSGFMDVCQPVLAQRGLAACTQKLHDFTVIQRRLNTPGDMGFVQSNDQYIAQEWGKPSMQIPQELVDALPDRVDQAAARMGWPYLRYSSRTVSNPPNGSEKRLLVYVPGRDFDRWIQFTVPEPGMPPQRLVDMIAIQKTGPDGQALSKPQISFKQFWRDENGQNPVPRNEASSAGCCDKCYTCHASGPRMPNPLPGSLDPIGHVAGDALAGAADGDLPRARLKQFQRQMASYVSQGIDWHGTIVPEQHGPAMGSHDPASCTSCHDGSTRGVINATTNRYHVGFKMRTERSMPPGGADDPDSLYRQILTDYRGDVRSWLQSTPCPGASTGENACNDSAKNGRIAAALANTPLGNVTVDGLQAALNASGSSDPELIAYARQCDLRAIVSGARGSAPTPAPGAPDGGATPDAGTARGPASKGAAGEPASEAADRGLTSEGASRKAKGKKKKKKGAAAAPDADASAGVSAE